jgi:hypothetical protein
MQPSAARDVGSESCGGCVRVTTLTTLNTDYYFTECCVSISSLIYTYLHTIFKTTTTIFFFFTRNGPFCVSRFFKQLIILCASHLAQNTHTHKRIIVLLRVKEEEIFRVVVLISLSLTKKEV